MQTTNRPPGAVTGQAAEKRWASFKNRSEYTAPAVSPQAAGLRPIGSIAAEVVADLRFRRQIQKLHDLGPRPIAEFLGELGAERSIRSIIDRKLERYAALDPKALEATNGSDSWPAPIQEVQP